MVITLRWRCCGCGAEAPNLVKSCDCATMCAGDLNTGRHAWMIDRPKELAAMRAERQKLDEQIKELEGLESISPPHPKK